VCPGKSSAFKKKLSLAPALKFKKKKKKKKLATKLQQNIMAHQGTSALLEMLCVAKCTLSAPTNLA
jgi:hypothetical protein